MNEVVLEKVTPMCEKVNLDIPDVVIDRALAYRIGNEYVDNSKIR